MVVYIDRMPSEKHRDYCMTINNYTETERQSVIDQSNVAYLVIGREVGESKTPHLQIYISYLNPRSFNAIKKQFPRAHIETWKYSSHQAAEYCKKEGDFVEFGTIPQQGRRTDIDEVRKVVKTTGSMRSVVDSCDSYQAVRMAEVMMKYYEPARDWQMNVKWYFGESGSGKSYQARIDFSGQDYYTCMTNGKWFEGYDGQSCVIIDDFREDFMKFKEFIQFLDRYEFRVETKGGSRQFRAHNVIITCPYHPNEVFKHTDEDNFQVLRRLTEIWWFRCGEPAMRDSHHVKLIHEYKKKMGWEK